MAFSGKDFATRSRCISYQRLPAKTETLDMADKPEDEAPHRALKTRVLLLFATTPSVVRYYVEMYASGLMQRLPRFVWLTVVHGTRGCEACPAM